MSLPNFDQAYQEFSKHYQKDVPTWLKSKISLSKHNYELLGIPTLKDERWKYTSLKPLRENSFQWQKLDSNIQSYIDRFHKPETITVVNGQLSDVKLAESISISPIDQYKSYDLNLFKKSLFETDPNVSDSLMALNESFLGEGVFINVKAASQVQKINLFYIFDSFEQAYASFIRNVIFVEKGAQADISETYLVYDRENLQTCRFINAVTDVYLEKNAYCKYAKFQRGTLPSLFLGNTRVFQQESSKLYAFFDQASLGKSRESVHVKLAGTSSHADLKGVFHTRKKEHMDYTVDVDHNCSRTTSSQLFKGIAEDQSHGVFCGNIRVHEGIEKVDAHQLSKNLLMGEQAEIDVKPQFKIDSDDVKCSHGATIGQMRDEEIFYMQTRGISKERSEQLLGQGFLDEVLLSIDDPLFQKDVRSHQKLLTS